MIRTVPKDSRSWIASNVINHLQRIGISSKEAQVHRCLIKLYPHITAERMRQAGLMVRTQQWLKGLFHAKFVFIYWSGNPCKWSRFIRVRNCGKYYVYLLFETPTCYLRYCGNSDQGNVKGGMGCLKFLLDHDTYLDQFSMPDRVARGNYSS